MKYVSWAIFIALFAFVENASPIGKFSSNYLNITEAFNWGIREIFSVYGVVGEMIGFHGNKTFNEELQGNKIKIISQECHSELLMIRNSSKIVQLEAQVFVSSEVHMKDSNQKFVTEIFPLNIILSQSDETHRTINDKEITWNNELVTTVSFPNFDHVNIKLLPSDYKYKSSNEESEIKQKIKNLFAATFDNNFKAFDFKKGLTYLREFSRNLESVSENDMELYYSIGTIVATDYTLNNVTIRGLGHILSISSDASNLENYLEIKMSHVRGTLMQNFHSKASESLDLNFHADNISIFKSRDAKFRVKSIGYSFKNTKSNQSLGDDQSKSIIKEIEKAFVI